MAQIPLENLENPFKIPKNMKNWNYLFRHNGRMADQVSEAAVDSFIYSAFLKRKTTKKKNKLESYFDRLYIAENAISELGRQFT